MATKDISRRTYRRASQDSKMGQISLTLPEAMLDRIDELGQKTGIRRSAVVQAALADYFRVQDLQTKTVTNLLYALPSLLPEAAELLADSREEEGFDGEGSYRYVSG